MRKLLTVIIILFTTPFICSQQINSNYKTIGYDYISPVPNSSFVSPTNNIIIRSHFTLNRQGILSNFITVTGSVSGSCSGKILLSDDSKTLIFKPTNKFALGEIVKVKLNAGSISKEGTKLNIYNFQFRVLSNQLENKYYSIEEMFKNINLTSSNVPLNKSFNITTDSLPEGFPNINIISSDSPDEGKFFTSPINYPTSDNNYLLISDNNGVPIFYRKMYSRNYDLKIQKNGYLTYYLENTHKFYAMNNSCIVIDSFACGNGYPTDVHELNILPNGHALLISYDSQHYDMDTVAVGGNPSALVVGAIIQELDNDKNVVFQWRSWDHYKITDAMPDIDLTNKNIDYVHGNAVELDQDGNILFSARNMDEVTKIDRKTGEIIWRLGGKNNQFTFINDEDKFSHQHDVRMLPNGNLTLFDNGNLHSPPYSRAVEYQIDDTAMTATLVWEYRNNPDFYSPAMGSNRQLSNGNRIIGWGLISTGSAEITELDPNNEVIFEANLPDTMINYRAFKFQWKTDLFTLSSYNIGFGTVPLGQTAALTLMIRNNSQDSLNITGFYHTNMSFLPDKEVPFTIHSGEEAPLIIKYTPDSSSLEYTTDRLYILSENPGERIAQVVKLSGETITQANDNNEIPFVFNLDQNYPNPFNPSTRISYQIPKDGLVTLKVFDMLGKRVATLVNKRESAGRYEVNFDASRLSSGVYIYKLRIGDLVSSKKMILMK